MARPLRWRTLLGNLALLGASILLVLGVAEILARIDFARRHGKEQRERTLYTDWDPLLGWRMRPGARVEYHRTEYSTEVVINSQGMRDKERSPLPRPDVFRILALGDSFTEAYMVDFNDAITQVLERALDRPNCPTEVLNAGVGGYSSDQEYLYYRDRGRLLAPRLVLLFFNHNDVLGNVRENYYSANKPRLAETPAGLVVTNLPVLPKPVDESGAQELKLRERSAAWAWLKERVLRGAPGAYAWLARLGLWEPFVGEESIPIEMKVFHRHHPDEIRRAWLMTDAILAALARQTEANGARLVVVYVPARFEIHDSDWELTRMRFRLQERRWNRQRVVQRLVESGSKGGFPVMDLTPALRRAAGGLGRRTYFRYDGHWNAFGQHVCGEEIASYLRAEGFVPACATAH